jgi:hypothetical protein
MQKIPQVAPGDPDYQRRLPTAITALLAAAAAIGILILLARRMPRAHLSALLVRGLFLLAGLLPATPLLTTLSLALILAALLLAALILLVHVFLQLFPA